MAGECNMIDFLKQAAAVHPSSRQLSWFNLQSYAFIHIGMNTFTDREWGLGNEPESIFNPEHLDCNQWVEAIKAGGMHGMVLVAKHHDGFCLWDTKYTDHNVMNSPLKRDVVREAAEACRKGGIKFGVYLSPWDRNNKLYGTEEYNDYYCNQLTELLTQYGDLFCVWFDNACGEGPNGRKQKYDFPRYISLIRKYQPDAVIFNDYGPDTRWCGNEAGVARSSEWAVVPSELCYWSEVQTGPGPMAKDGELSFMYNTDQAIGTMSNIIYSRGLVFAPSEINTSIRPGWFWHTKEEPKSVEELFRIYITSVGGNACLNLNLPPNRDGLIDERDIKRLKEWKAYIDQEFGHPIPAVITKIPSPYETQPEYSIRFESPRKDIRYVVLREDIEQGQRVESFKIYAGMKDGSKFPFYQGTTIGNRKICQIYDPFKGQNPLTRYIPDGVSELIVKVTSARDEVFMKSIEVY